MKLAPRLSVCIPTWNGAPTIERAMTSILGQEGVELELVVCDDASEDETCARVRGFDDPRVRLFANRERAGIVGNWNSVLSHARGEYAVVFGQDDEVDPDWARTLTDALDAHPGAAMAFCRRRFVYDSPEAEEQLGDFFSGKYRAWLDTFYASFASDDEVLSIGSESMVRAAMVHDFEINLIGEPAFVMFRREHPSLREGYDPRMNQMIDWEFCLRMVAAGPIVHCARELGSFHLRASGTSADNAKNLERHYREYDYMLGRVLESFERWLDADMRARLEERRRNARAQLPDQEQGTRA